MNIVCDLRMVPNKLLAECRVLRIEMIYQNDIIVCSFLDSHSEVEFRFEGSCRVHWCLPDVEVRYRDDIWDKLRDVSQIQIQHDESPYHMLFLLLFDNLHFFLCFEK